MALYDGFEEWYREEHPMSDMDFEVVRDSIVYLAMRKAYHAGYEKGVGDGYYFELDTEEMIEAASEWRY